MYLLQASRWPSRRKNEIRRSGDGERGAVDAAEEGGAEKVRTLTGKLE